MSERTVYKSAISGEFVSRKYAEDHPETTFAETVDQTTGATVSRDREHIVTAPTDAPTEETS